MHSGELMHVLAEYSWLSLKTFHIIVIPATWILVHFAYFDTFLCFSVCTGDICVFILLIFAYFYVDVSTGGQRHVYEMTFYRNYWRNPETEICFHPQWRCKQKHCFCTTVVKGIALWILSTDFFGGTLDLLHLVASLFSCMSSAFFSGSNVDAPGRTTSCRDLRGVHIFP